jgi:type IV pilus assembly protein PilC
MPRYKYTAEGNDGFAAAGTIEAESPAGAGLALMERGLYVKKLSEQKSLLQYELIRKRVSRKELMHFSRQLAVFLRAGIPIIDALEIIRQETPPKKLLASVLADMMEALRAGSTFTATAVTHPKAFPPYYIGMLEAAELTGNLDRSLDEVANYIDRDVEARRKVQSALFYPGVVFLMSVATVLVLTSFVLPRFKTFFEELNAKLPLPTRMLLAGSGLVSKGWPLILLFLVGLIGTLVYGVRTEKGRALRDHLVLRLPVVGDLVRTAIVERFCRTLSSMVRSGVPLPDALIVTANGTNNAVYKQGLSQVQTMMLEGQGLAGPIASTDLFPGAARQMIRVGEETGTLDTQLETAAKYYERDLDFKITRFTNLFEPAVILFMGVVVGFVAVALISAMYGIFGQMGSM